MIGTIKSIPSKNDQIANYAFVKGEDNKEYFLHASDLENSWEDLKDTIAAKRIAQLEFTPTRGLKGPRAEKARLL